MKYIMLIVAIFFSSNSIAETPQNLIEFINQYKGSYNHPLFLNNEGKLKDDLEGVNELIRQVDDEIDSGSTDPRVYWLRPYLKIIWLLMYQRYHDPELNKLYGDEFDAHPIVAKIKAEAIPDYEKALQLNKTASDDEKLNNDMISKIYINRSLPAHILEMTSRENMSFMKKTGHFENEREVYQQFYFDMINSYIRDKDYGNALRILKEFDGVQGGVLEENLPMLEAHKAKWEKEALEETKQVEQQIITEPTEPEITESVSVTTTDEQQPVVKEKDEQQSYEDLLDLNNGRIFVISVTLVLLLLVAFVAVRRKNKK